MLPAISTCALRKALPDLTLASDGSYETLLKRFCGRMTRVFTTKLGLEENGKLREEAN
jgi:hypothetical protein